MKFLIYAIFDRKAKTYSDMFLSANHGTAIRDFGFLVSADPVKKHISDDLELYCFGSFDSLTGKLLALDAPEFISEGQNEEQ